MPIPKVKIISQIHESFDHGSKTVGTSAVQITTTSVPVQQRVIIKSAAGNEGTIYVGNSDVTAASADATDGLELSAGESIAIEIDNANKVYAIASQASQEIFWMSI